MPKAKPTVSVKPKTHFIICHQPKAPKDACQLFQLDGMNYFVPYNKSVEVPEWVYKVWLDSKYNVEREITAGVDPEHLNYSESADI